MGTKKLERAVYILYEYIPVHAPREMDMSDLNKLYKVSKAEQQSQICIHTRMYKRYTVAGKQIAPILKIVTTILGTQIW